MNDSAELIYVIDPMCSWCWGFRPTWQQIAQWAQPRLPIRYVLGGLAADTDEPMPLIMCKQIQAHWRRIQQQIPGTQFNHDFWTNCQPRRSTYPACRAVIVARNIDVQLEVPMIEAIQQAYYLLAQNPSEEEVLVELAVALGISAESFRTGLAAKETEALLAADIRQARAWALDGFPTVFLRQREEQQVIGLSYRSPQLMIEQIVQAIYN